MVRALESKNPQCSALRRNRGLLALRRWRRAIGFLDRKSASDVGVHKYPVAQNGKRRKLSYFFLFQIFLFFWPWVVVSPDEGCVGTYFGNSALLDDCLLFDGPRGFGFAWREDVVGEVPALREES